MIKESLIKVADRSFGWIAATLMRRAIAPLLYIEEPFLLEVGLSRAAIADFLETPLHTDPCIFFARRRAQARSRHTTADVNLHEHCSTKSDSICQSADGGVVVNSCGKRPARFGRSAICCGAAQMTRLSAGVLTAVVITTFSALTACSVNPPEQTPAEIQRERAPARCRVRPDSFQWSVQAPATLPAYETVLTGLTRSAIADGQRLNTQPDARDGPIRSSS